MALWLKLIDIMTNKYLCRILSIMVLVVSLFGSSFPLCNSLPFIGLLDVIEYKIRILFKVKVFVVWKKYDSSGVRIGTLSILAI